MKSGGDSVSPTRPAGAPAAATSAPTATTYCTTIQEPLSSADGYSLSTEGGLPRIMKGESPVSNGEPVLVREPGQQTRLVLPRWNIFFKLDSTEPEDPDQFELQITKLLVSIKQAATGDMGEQCGTTASSSRGPIQVYFIGMADTTGSDPYNHDLSRRRYLAVTSRIKEIVSGLPGSMRTPYGVHFYAFAAGEQPARAATPGNVDNVEDPRFRRVDAHVTTGKPPLAATWEKIDSIPAIELPPAPPEERGVIHEGVDLCDATTGRGPGNAGRLSRNERGALVLDLCMYRRVIGETEPVAIMVQGALQTIHPWRIVPFDDQGRPADKDVHEAALWNEIREARNSTGFMKTCVADVVEHYQGVQAVRIDIVVGSADSALVAYAQDLKRRLEAEFPGFATATISFQPAHDTRFPRRAVAIQPTVVFNGDAGQMGAWYTFETVPPPPLELIDVETVVP